MLWLAIIFAELVDAMADVVAATASAVNVGGIGEGDECLNGGHPHCTDGDGTLLLFIALHELE